MLDRLAALFAARVQTRGHGQLTVRVRRPAAVRGFHAVSLDQHAGEHADTLEPGERRGPRPLLRLWRQRQGRRRRVEGDVRHVHQQTHRSALVRPVLPFRLWEIDPHLLALIRGEIEGLEVDDLFADDDVGQRGVFIHDGDCELAFVHVVDEHVRRVVPCGVVVVVHHLGVGLALATGLDVHTNVGIRFGHEVGADDVLGALGGDADQAGVA